MTDIRGYVESAGIAATVLEDHGILKDQDSWEHHSFTVRLDNPRHGGHMVTPWRQGLGITTHPGDTPAEIVDSLVSDAWSYLRSRSFEDWAGEFGYDTDSRKAEKIYQTLADLAPIVVAFLGGQDEFDHVATDIERL